MVPPEEIEELNAPTTLPADFGEWDSGESSAAQPAKPATARVAVPPVVDRIPHAGSARIDRGLCGSGADVSAASAQKRETYKDESKGKRKKLMPLIGAGSLAFVLVLGFL
jgi:hypothetical protein